MKKTIFFLLFLSIGLTSCDKVIESPENVKGFIQGRWHDERVDQGGLITYYRFEISETEIRCWKSSLIITNSGRSSDNEKNDWEELTPVPLSIGSVQTEAENASSYEKEYRTLGDCSYGTYTFECNSKLGNSLIFRDNSFTQDDFHTGKLERGWEY